MNRDEQRAVLADLVQRAKTAGLKIRWNDAQIVVIGLPPDGQTEVSNQQVPVPNREEGRRSEGTVEGTGPGEDEGGGQGPLEEAQGKA